MAFCKTCGAELMPGAQFCNNCGAAVSNDYVNPATAATMNDVTTVSQGSGIAGLKYVVLQVTLKEKFIGTGSGNLTELEAVINAQASKGYRLHTITTATGNSAGFLGGDRIQATMVFERIDD